MNWYRSEKLHVAAAVVVLVAFLALIPIGICRGASEQEQREHDIYDAGVRHGRAAEECLWYCTMAQPDITRPGHTGRIVHHAWPLRPKCECILKTAEKVMR